MSSAYPILLSSFLGILGLPFAIYTPNLVPSFVSAVVAWFFLIPISNSLRNATPGESFRRGYWFGLATNLGWYFWVSVAQHKYGHLSLFVSGTILFLMVAMFALLPALGFWMMARIPAPRWLAGTLVFALLYWLLIRFPFGGYPWALPAYFLYGALSLIQIADIIGAVGITSLLMLGNFVLADVLEARRTKSPIPRVGAIAFSVFFLISLIYGITRPELEETPSLRVALLQGNIPQKQKRDRAYLSNILDTYLGLSQEAEKSNADLIVWPEASLPYSLPAETKSLATVLPKDAKANFVIGSPTWSMLNSREQFRNSAFVLSPDGEVRVRYDKQHLVPFGEYVPFSDILPTHYIVPSVAGHFVAGTESKLADVKGKKFGILICYEVLFPELALTMAREGATFFVNITNDAWFDETSGPYQHVHFTQFRAVETRRAVVRAANTGITTWTDPSGRLHEPTSLFTQAAVLADIPTRDDLTFFVRWPYLVPVLMTFLLLAASLGVFGTRKIP